MKETDEIVAQLKLSLAAKRTEIDRAGIKAIAYVNEAYSKRRHEVIDFELSLQNFACHDSEKSMFIERYTQEAKYLLGGISKILV